MSLRKEIVSILEEMADLMEFEGQNRFKVNAFKNGANTIRRLPGDLEEMINDKSINDVKGIGKGLQQVIYEYYETGSAKDYEALVEKVPEGIHEILMVRGLGAKKVKIIYDELKVDSLEKLELACKNGSIVEVKGLSDKSVEKILKEIDRIKKSSGYMLLSRALDRSKLIIDELEKIDSVINVDQTGELRRKREVISRIELICQYSDLKKFEQSLSNVFTQKDLTVIESCQKYTLFSDETCEFELYASDENNYSKSLLLTTGSVEFLQKMRDPGSISFNSESEYFEMNSSTFIIPEMREDAFFESAESLRDQTDLSSEHMKGFFHFHTTFSDGNSSLDEMLRGIKGYGFEYAVVCDHSKSAFYANGLKEERLILQRKEIDKWNETGDIKVYHGIESDILKDGSLDYDDNILSQFHFIVASIHSNFNMSEEEMTRRIIRAVENEYTDLLAHPTGRLLLTRDGYKVNIKKVIDACAANDVAIEINANPHRLDLDWRNLYYAREKGCRISINPDAHSVEGISDIEYGIMIARKGGVQPEEVVNCYSEKEFKSYINRKVKRN